MFKKSELMKDFSSGSSDQDFRLPMKDADLIPGWEGKIPHDSWPKSQNIKK